MAAIDLRQKTKSQASAWLFHVFLVRLQEWNSPWIPLTNKDFPIPSALPCPQICPQFSGTLWFDCPRLRRSSKNWLFAGSDSGSQRALYSIIATANLNGVNPQAYLRHVLAHFANHPVNCVDEPLPWAVEVPVEDAHVFSAQTPATARASTTRNRHQSSLNRPVLVRNCEWVTHRHCGRP